MNITYKRRPGFLRLFLPAFLTILPMLMLGGGLTNSVQAGAPIGASSASQVQREEVFVLRVYFNSIEQRDMLAGELGAEEVATTNGYLTVLADRPMYNDLVTRGLRIEIDERQTKVLNEPHFWGDSFYGGYKTVEETQAYLAQMATTYPTLAQVVDYGDSWCKANPGACPQPAPFNGYDLMALHITNQAIPGPKPVYWFDAGIHSREIATPEMAMRLIAWLLDRYETDADSHWPPHR
jgi:hypothetical protein